MVRDLFAGCWRISGDVRRAPGRTAVPQPHARQDLTTRDIVQRD